MVSILSKYNLFLEQTTGNYRNNINKGNTVCNRIALAIIVIY